MSELYHVDTDLRNHCKNKKAESHEETIRLANLNQCTADITEN